MHREVIFAIFILRYNTNQMIIKSKNSFPFLITIIIFFLATILSCKIVRHGSISEKSGQLPAANPRIIFINYSVTFDKSKGVQDIRLIDKTITDGKLKNSISVTGIPKPGDLFCFVLNSLMVPVDTVLIPDPLNLTVESVDDNNSLFKKEVTLDSAQFTLRLQFDEKIWAVGIRTRIKPENSNNYLLITKIKEP